ncbi:MULTISPECIES: hypothetical protein [Cycloclasticus]|jgi:ABC-type phosphate transport system substrate-binding protein|uniref:PBP superfamily domain-containing protein n=1 Tax=Cycloclasticus pugetii TaxID=34068 RepID=A0AB33YZ09_9GAMM|nr:MULTISPECIES: hypothetical protein [Cycloclasticus]ATI02308.1 hypothetical protein CPC19_02170 [Cycloclasticus sp. PY97N]EPD12395.1 hypothetical protein L196_09754 [Cycloclasticus pugetii]
MERVRFIIFCLICQLSPLSQAVELIAHPSVPVDRLSATAARNIFTMRTLYWPSGRPIKVFVLSDENALHQQFSKTSLHVFPYKLRRIWDRNIYSGTGEAPITVDSEEEMLKAISSSPGAIGYANKGNDNVRIIKID